MKKIIALVLVGIMILVSTSCGEDAPAEKNTESVAADTSYDSMLTIFAHKPDTLCPLLTTSETNVQMLRNVFDGLISLNGGLEAEPRLAEGWSVSADGMLWTLKLRNDAKWHDGAAFTADDVVYTVNQIKLHEDSIFAANVSNIAEIRKKDTHTVEIEVNKPWLNFINLLYFPVVKKSSGDIDAESFSPVGTGAYVFSDSKAVDKYHLVRNENWWGGNPVTECIKVELLDDAETALYAFSAGNIDLTMAVDVNWGKFVDSATASYKSVNSSELTFIGINNNNGALRFPEVRRAVSYGVNRQKMVNDIMLNFAVPTSVPIHPDWKIYADNKFEVLQNVDAARTELEAGGWFETEGCWVKEEEGISYKTTFSMLYNEENTVREAIAQQIKQDLEGFGMTVTLEKVSFEDYESRIASGNYDLFVGEIIVAPDVDFSFLMGEGNIFRFANDEMTGMRDTLSVRKSSDVLAYTPLLEKMYTENPVVSLFFENKILVHSNRLEGDFVPTSFEIYKGIDKLQKKEAEN